MKSKISMILETYLALLKKFNLGMSVTVDGDFLFNDRATGRVLRVSSSEIIRLYDEIGEDQNENS